MADYNVVVDPTTERLQLTTWFRDLEDAVIDEGRCIQCGACEAVCPTDSIGVGPDDLPELVKSCIGCGRCWDHCPRGGLRYERQWTITGGADNVSGAGDPITEYTARTGAAWRSKAQDGGVVTAMLVSLLEAGEIDGALVARESEAEPWKGEGFLATTEAELLESAGSYYNQTMALGHLDLDRWAEKLPDKPRSELQLAVVGTPCEIEGLCSLEDFDRDYGAQETGLEAVEYRIALMCTKNFNHEKLIGEKLHRDRDIAPEEIGKLDIIEGVLRVYDHDSELFHEEAIEEFHDAALKGCSECADFTGYTADVTVGSVGSPDGYSSVIVRTEAGMRAWEAAEPRLEAEDLADRGAIGGLQSWDKEQAFEALDRPFDPDAPRFIEYGEHVAQYSDAEK